MCREGESNSHGLLRTILSRVRLPIPPPRQEPAGINLPVPPSRHGYNVHQKPLPLKQSSPSYGHLSSQGGIRPLVEEKREQDICIAIICAKI